MVYLVCMWPNKTGRKYRIKVDESSNNYKKITTMGILMSRDNTLRHNLILVHFELARDI